MISIIIGLFSGVIRHNIEFFNHFTEIKVFRDVFRSFNFVHLGRFISVCTVILAQLIYKKIYQTIYEYETT